MVVYSPNCAGPGHFRQEDQSTLRWIREMTDEALKLNTHDLYHRQREGAREDARHGIFESSWWRRDAMGMQRSCGVRGDV